MGRQVIKNININIQALPDKNIHCVRAGVGLCIMLADYSIFSSQPIEYLYPIQDNRHT